MDFVPNEVFYARFDKKKKKVSTFYDPTEDQTECIKRRATTALPTVDYEAKVAYIDSTKHVAIKKVIFSTKNY